MKTNLQRFAPWGLYLALLAGVASIGLFIVYRAWNLPLQISLAITIIGVALYAILDPAQVRSAITGRQARYGSNVLIMSVAFIGILVVINYVAYKNPKSWDLTADKQNTLAQETIDTLQKLPQPVKAQAFFTTRVSSTDAENRLARYKSYAKGKFTYEFINPDENPGLVQQYNLTSDGSIVLSMGDRSETVTSSTEEDLTGALVRMMANKVTVYFLTGHGEFSPEDTGNQSLSVLKGLLEKKNYTVKTLNLLAEKKIPEDARVLMIAGPQKPLTDDEIKTISTFVTNGGGAVILEETPLVTEMGTEQDPLANYLSQTWGITLGNDVVIDYQSNSPFAPYAYQYGSHAITNDIRLSSVYPLARSIQHPEQAAQDETITDLVKTAPFPNTYAETDLEGLKNNQNPQPDEGKDLQGPITIGVAGENSGTRARLAVFGDRDFASDQFINGLGNSTVIINSIDWASAQESLINLTPRQTTSRLMVSPTPVTLRLVFLGTVIVIPALVLLFGILVWYQRRRKG